MSAASTLVEPRSDLQFPTTKKGRGGGPGGGPSELQKVQVIVYRSALILSALAYFAAFFLDFLGGNIIGWSQIIPTTAGAAAADSQVASYVITASRVADILAAVAALAVPMGSLLIGRITLTLLGALSVGVAAFGLGGPGTLGAAAGPVCIMMILAREVYWFGLSFKVDAALGILLFAAVAILRSSAGAESSSGLAPDALTREEDLYLGIAAATDDAVTAMGPPLPLEGLSATVLLLVSFGKLLASIGEDVDEEGEQWQKSSTNMVDTSIESDAGASAGSGESGRKSNAEVDPENE